MRRASRRGDPCRPASAAVADRWGASTLPSSEPLPGRPHNKRAATCPRKSRAVRQNLRGTARHGARRACWPASAVRRDSAAHMPVSACSALSRLSAPFGAPINGRRSTGPARIPLSRFRAAVWSAPFPPSCPAGPRRPLRDPRHAPRPARQFPAPAARESATTRAPRPREISEDFRIDWWERRPGSHSGWARRRSWRGWGPGAVCPTVFFRCPSPTSRDTGSSVTVLGPCGGAYTTQETQGKAEQA